MRIVIIIVGVLLAIVLYFFLLDELGNWLGRKASKKKQEAAAAGEDVSDPVLPEYKQYIGDEHKWKPTFHLKHEGFRVFNLPFTPEKTEVFYLENEYDEKANTFIKEHKDYIKQLLQARATPLYICRM